MNNILDNSYTLKDVFRDYENDENSFNKFNTFCINLLVNFLTTYLDNYIATDVTKNQLTLSIITPIWRRYKNAYVNFPNTLEGIEDFKDNFSSQLEEVAFDFTTYANANAEYFSTFVDKAKHDTPFSKNIDSDISPINEELNIELNKSKLAKGTTGQSVSEYVYLGSAWASQFKRYMTPQKKNDMLKSFVWLFDLYVVKCDCLITDDILELTDLKKYATLGYRFAEIKSENLKPENIKKGENILGVVGTYDIPLEDIYEIDLNEIDFSDDITEEITPPNPAKTILVFKDSNLKAENIKSGIEISGIIGTYIGDFTDNENIKLSNLEWEE